jgi:DNA ligase-1
MYILSMHTSVKIKELHVKFKVVADCFDILEQTNSRLEMTQALARLLSMANSNEIGVICNISMGQLAPPHIGTQFSIAAKNMIKIIAGLQGVTEEAVAAQFNLLGDLGLVVAQGHPVQDSQLTLMQVYDELLALERIHGAGSVDEKSNVLQRLLASLDANSAKYVVRIVLGKLRLGFSDMTLLDALSWSLTGDKSLKDVLEYAYNKCADIALIAQIVKEKGVAGLADLHVRLGIPIRPAAAERMSTAEDVVNKLGHCMAQPKLDGFRLQIHVDKSGNEPKVWFFSRNLQDMSYMFPDLTEAVKALPVTTLICEGEAIVYDSNTNVFLPFQETVKRKRKHGIEEAMEEFPLRVYLFDILYKDGQSLIDSTHMMRREVLLSMLEENKHDAVQAIDEEYITSGQQLLHYFQKNISAGLEGLVVKRPDSVYTPGKRNFNWIKLKRQEEGHLDDTLDCVVLGYYYGHGKRALFGIGAFLVGVYNKTSDRFETIAKVGTGLSDDEWRALRSTCDQMKVAEQPKNVACAKELAPDVWVHPETVCMIRADEITLSPVHMANKTDENLGFALRFPRFMGYRPDKAAKDATDVEEVMRLFEIQMQKGKQKTSVSEAVTHDFQMRITD